MASKNHPVYDPVAKRWKSTCPHCGRIFARAKRESADWNLANHLAYNHEGE